MRRLQIKQHDQSDCGAACLASVAAYYGLNIPLAIIRQYAGTRQDGTNVYGMLQASEKLGFYAKGVRGGINCLREIPKPAIAHIEVNKTTTHYIVLYKAGKDYLAVMDPANGKIQRMSVEGFEGQWTGVLILLTPGERFAPGDRQVSVLKRFWFLFRPHRYILAQAFIGALVYTMLGFSTSLYIQKLTDYIFIGGNTNLLNLLSIIMLLLLFFQILIASFKDIMLVRTGQLIDLRLILGYYRHLLTLPQQFFDTMRIGELLSRISDALKIRNFINAVVLNLTVNILIVLFSFVLMFALHWQLAMVMLMIIPAYTALYMIANQLNKKTERRVMEASANLESQLVETLSTMKTIKYFGLEGDAEMKTESRFVSLLQKSYKSALNTIFSTNSTAVIGGAFTIVLLWTGSHYVVRREITPGELLSFYAILGYFTGPVSSLIKANKSIQNALIAADRLFEIMDLERDTPDQAVIHSYNVSGDIRFWNIGFRYGNSTRVFQDLDLLIPKGSITAIIGESGSGKSTLVNILLGLYPLEKGKVTIGETDLRYLKRDCLRDMIAVVPQEIHLFSGTLLENIAVGSHKPDAAKVLEICRVAGMGNFIEALPLGLNTFIGENGAGLSGGQKQRIAFARALYRDPEVLILDEATASVDSHAEEFIKHTIHTIRDGGKTVILISHRLSTVVHADKIAVLHKGRIAEEGTHEELLLKKSLYRALWEKQIPPETTKAVRGYF
jgi:ATP-binding cassette subfamily B protein